MDEKQSIKIVVTGASGLVGRALFDYFKEGSNELIGTSFSNINQDLVSLDLTNEHEVKAFLAAEKPDVIIHCAATLPQSHEGEESRKSAAMNAAMDSHLIEFCKNNGCRLIYFSSAFAYDRKTGSTPLTEESKVVPAGDYLAQKLESERTIEQTLSDYIILRLSSPFGAKYTRRTVFSIFLERALNNDPIGLTGSSNRVQDFVYVGDVCKAVEMLLIRKQTGLYNMSNGTSSNLLELAESIVAATGSSSQINSELTDSREGVENNRFDNSKLLSDTGIEMRTLDSAMKALFLAYEAGNSV